MVCYRSQIAKGKYNQNNSIKLETETIKSNLYDYSDAFILVTGYTMIQMLHLNIVRYFLPIKQKLMMCLLMKQIIFILQCLCTI